MFVKFFAYNNNFFPYVIGRECEKVNLGRRNRQRLTQDSPLPPAHVLQSIADSISCSLSWRTSSCIVLPQDEGSFVHLLTPHLNSDTRLCFIAWGEGDVGLGVLSYSSLPLPSTSMHCAYEQILDAQNALRSSILPSCASILTTLSSATLEYHNSTCASLLPPLDEHLAVMVVEFLGPLQPKHSSRGMLEWLYRSSVLQVSLDSCIHGHLAGPELKKELLQERFVDLGNRSHLLKSYAPGRVYFWNNSPILCSSSFGPELFKLTSSLMGKHLWMHSTKDALLSLYSTAGSHLNFHNDVFDNQPETVILFFLGGPRQLHFRGKARRGFFRSAMCDPHTCLILTPLANTIFVHAKSKALSDDLLSISIAFRNALSIYEACRKFPEVKRQLGVSSKGLALLEELFY